ncbi:MAG TPA: radical SAM protein [Candidatus Wunengus sp. YC63]|uniref:radical SAM protein n=1 Tax=Candidatus Wunengus sp. YC63 TaxID=3367699 RepID=UPI004024EDB4
MSSESYLAGSPYYIEEVLGIDMYDRAQKGQLTHLLLNQPPVCDSHCRRCFMPKERRNIFSGQLTLEESTKLIRDAAKAGIFCLEISGEGEPLLSNNIKGIIQAAYDSGFTTTLITNGHQLSEDIVRFFFERNVTLVVSLFSLKKDIYEMDNSLPGSFERTIARLQEAAKIYSAGTKCIDGKNVYRMAIHTTAQVDNIDELQDIKKFCSVNRIFLSLAPLAPVGGGQEHRELLLTNCQNETVLKAGYNSIILSKTSIKEIGREVCGTCLYGLNIGYDGNLLFDAHAGYEVGDTLGNVRRNSIEELIDCQRTIVSELFANIDGFCPVRDPKWPVFLKSYIAKMKTIRNMLSAT